MSAIRERKRRATFNANGNANDVNSDTSNKQSVLDVEDMTEVLSTAMKMEERVLDSRINVCAWEGCRSVNCTSNDKRRTIAESEIPQYERGELPWQR